MMAAANQSLAMMESPPLRGDLGDAGWGHVTKTDITDGKTGQEYIRTYDKTGILPPTRSGTRPEM